MILPATYTGYVCENMRCGYISNTDRIPCSGCGARFFKAVPGVIPGHHSVTVHQIREDNVPKHETRAYCDGSMTEYHMAREASEAEAINSLKEQCGQPHER